MISSLTISQAPNGNWQLTPVAVAHNFPPIAFPASLTLAEVQRSAAAMLENERVPAPVTLEWRRIGHTVLASGAQAPAYRARWAVTVENV